MSSLRLKKCLYVSTNSEKSRFPKFLIFSKDFPSARITRTRDQNPSWCVHQLSLSSSRHEEVPQIPMSSGTSDQRATSRWHSKPKRPRRQQTSFFSLPNQHHGDTSRVSSAACTEPRQHGKKHGRRNDPDGWKCWRSCWSTLQHRWENARGKLRSIQLQGAGRRPSTPHSRLCAVHVSLTGWRSITTSAILRNSSI